MAGNKGTIEIGERTEEKLILQVTGIEQIIVTIGSEESFVRA